MVKAKKVSKKAQKVLVSSSGVITPKREFSKDPLVAPTRSNVALMIEAYEILYRINKETRSSMAGVFRKLLEEKTSSRMHLRVLLNMIRKEIASLKRKK
jgi:hypothetical protein